MLNQAYYNGIPIVIDDCSHRDEYNHLLDMEYIMMQVDHKRMSVLLLECKQRG